MNHVTKQFFHRSLAATCAVWFSFSALAAGLGDIRVESALGQPLTAEIEVTGLPTEEFARVLARIASPEDYQTAKLIYLPLLRQVGVAGARRSDGKNVLKISSVAPINEPTFDLLVDLNWRGGRLLQKYSVLLDPPK